MRRFIEDDYPRVVAAVALVAGTRAAAEDAVQEALARAWDHARPIDSLKAWVTAVAMNLTRSSIRRLIVERRIMPRLTSNDMDDPSAASTDRVAIAEAVRTLPRRQREVTVLHYYLDMPVTEIAHTLRVKEGTVKTCLHRARQALAVALGADDTEVPVADHR